MRYPSELERVHVGGMPLSQDGAHLYRRMGTNDRNFSFEPASVILSGSAGGTVAGPREGMSEQEGSIGRLA